MLQADAAVAAGGAAGGGQAGGAWTTLRQGHSNERLFATRLAMLAKREQDGRRTRRGCAK